MMSSGQIVYNVLIQGEASGSTGPKLQKISVSELRID